MLRFIIVFVCILQLVFAAPQFVSFKDGKIGVNFGGYHAAAGLGGLLTGNAAHGGLSASAGTPWGPQAAAGLGGNLDGRAAGGAYAGAQFSPEIGASSVLGGNVGGGRSGFVGAEAHSNGNVVSKSYGGVASGANGGAEVGAGVGGGVSGDAEASAGAQYPLAPPEATDYNVRVNSIQKIKPPKKYNLVKPELNTDQHQNVEGSVTKTSVLAVRAEYAPVNSDNANNYGPPPAATAASTSVATPASTEAVHVVNQPSVDGVIIVKSRHQEHQQKLHERRRLAHEAHKARKQARKDAKAAAAAAAAVSQQSVKDVAINAAPAHSKQVVKTYYKEVRAPAAHTVAAPAIPTNNLNVHAPTGHAAVAPLAPSYDQQVPAEGAYHTSSANLHLNTGLVGNVLNIPIGILRSLQESLAGININKSVSYTKLV